MSTTTSPILRDALAQYRSANGLSADEGARTFWTCRLGPIRLRLPNFAWRRKAIEAHDLHHVATGYPCTMCGEFQMAAWEFGAGRMPHWAATLFCLPLVLVGLFWVPQRTFSAFAAGRRSRSLHGSEVSEEVLAAPLQVFRVELSATGPIGEPWSDRAQFALLILRASLLSLSPMALLIGVWIVLRAA